jgi:hypothetical protein
MIGESGLKRPSLRQTQPLMQSNVTQRGYYTSTQLKSDLAPQFKPRIVDDAIDLLNYFTKEIAFSRKEGADKGEYHIRLVENVGLAPLQRKVS